MNDIISVLKELPRHRPFYRYLNLSVEELERGKCKIFLPFDEKLTIGYGVIHGGVIASIMDVAGSMAASTITGKRSPTISLHVHYLKYATSSLTSVAYVTESKKKAVFTEIRTYNSENELVANGLGVFGISDRKFTKEE